ncbi:lipooligosaccharide transport system permease protein [Marmoricola sp. URHA0025 HA25]
MGSRPSSTTEGRITARDRLDVRRAARMADYWTLAYVRTWKGSAISSFVVPLLYVLAMGVLLGGFIKGDPDKLEGATSYLSFVAPGMLAAQSMTRVFGEVTYPVMGMIKWQRVYYGMIATPLSVRDIVFSHLVFVAVRVAMGSAVFIAVMAPFGVFESFPGVVGAFLAQLLVGMAFAAPVYALSAALKDESGYALVFRLGMIPMFLFSGAFFPVANLDAWMEALAKLTPLWHGVDLTRMLVLGEVDGSRALVHIAYLAALTLVGWVLATRLLHRRLID